MAIAFVAAAGFAYAGGPTITNAYTVGSGSDRLLVVGVTVDGVSDVVSGVTYNSVSMTLAVKLTPSGSDNGAKQSYIYYLLGPASGANNIVVTTSVAAEVVAADYTGVAQSGQTDATNTHDVNSASPSDPFTSSITTVADNSLVVLLDSAYSFGNPSTAGTGATRRAYGATIALATLYDCGTPVTPAGSYSMTINGRNEYSNTHILASFSPTGGGGGGAMAAGQYYSLHAMTGR